MQQFVYLRILMKITGEDVLRKILGNKKGAQNNWVIPVSGG